VAGLVADAAAFDRAYALSVDRIAFAFASWGIGDVRGALDYLWGLLRIGRVVRRRRPDRIHCGKCLPEGLLAAMIKRIWGIPFCCFVHGEELTLAMTSKDLRRLTRKVLFEATAVIANSNHTKALLAQWDLPSNQVVVMHPGVDTARFVPAPDNPSTRSRLGWSGRRVLLTVGALQRRKGQDMLIRALPLIRQRCPDVLYSIVGEGWERPYLDDLVRRHNVGDLVQFRSNPSDEEIIECYQQCDLFVLPNRQVGWDFEGFGIVLLEAQACAKAVVAGASGGTLETIVPGTTGLLVACEGPDDLGDLVGNLLEDPQRRTSMGTHGRRWVVDNFDWAVLAEQASRTFAAL
jgi:phosphatidylinositol alpha-1,6-mannosyltransferase